MSLIRCRKCDNEFSDKAKTCPKCGWPTASASNKIKLSHKKILIVSCVLFVMAAFGLVYGVTRFTCHEFTRNRNYYKNLKSFHPEDSYWENTEMRWSGKEVIKLGVTGVTSCVGSVIFIYMGVSLLSEDRKSKLEEDTLWNQND